MERHRNLIHTTGANDDQGQQPIIEVDLEEGHSDTDQGYSSDDQTSTDDENENEAINIWKYIKEEAWTSELQEMFRTKKIALLEEGMPASDAHQAAYKHVLPTLRQNIRRVYMDKIQLNMKLRHDRVHKQILATKRKLEDEEDFDSEEAMRYAVQKRKYLIQDVTATLSDNELDEVDNDNTDDTEDNSDTDVDEDEDA